MIKYYSPKEPVKVSQDIQENYNMLSLILDGFLQITGVDKNRFIDVCLMICMRNWYSGSNDKKMSADKFLVSDLQDEVWCDVQRILGLAGVSAIDTQMPLPRVQRERVIFDAMGYCVSTSVPTENQEKLINFRKAIAYVNKKGYTDVIVEGRCLHTTINSTPKIRGVFETVVSEQDITEEVMYQWYSLYAQFINYVNGVSVKEEEKVPNIEGVKEDNKTITEDDRKDTKETDDVNVKKLDIAGTPIGEVMKYYNKKSNGVRLLHQQVVLPKDYEEQCKDLSGVSYSNLELTRDIESAFFMSLADSLLMPFIDFDTFGNLCMIYDVADGVGKPKFHLMLSDNTIRKLSNVPRTMSALYELFNVNSGSMKSYEEGLKALIALSCSSSDKVVTEVKQIRNS